jgi:histidinol-phosphate/aromatic aminotransferase/cobyric acid decarboxylase-like protein
MLLFSNGIIRTVDPSPPNPEAVLVGDDGAATRAALLEHSCVVRDCTSFGLPECVRVAPRRNAENALLIAAWKEII